MNELEEKIERAVNKVMENFKTEIEPNQIIKDGDYIYFRGEKYQKVETPESFHTNLWALLRTKLDNPLECTEMVYKVRDLIREYFPEPMMCDYEEYDAGYNEAIRQINERF